MDQRIKTGIEGYDNLLGGGYLPKSVNLIVGCSGSGKTLFTMSFLYHGAVHQNKKCVYITLEELSEHVIRDCKIVGMDIDAVSDDILQVYDLSSLRVNALETADELESDKSPMLLENLLEVIKINYSDVDLLALDSIVPIAIAYENDHIFRAELFRFMMGLRKMGITVVFTSEIAYSSNDVSRFGMEDFLADSVTLLRIREEWGRQIKVHKMRGSNHVKNFVDYDISSEGIKVLYK